MMRRHTSLKRYTPAKKQSKEQAKRVYAYRIKRKRFLSAEHPCAVVINGRRLEGCRLIATQVHHARGRIGERLLEEEYFIPVCDGPCHRWLEINPKAARALGLSQKRNN